MADINITVTIPDEHVASVKSAIEYYLKHRGELEADKTLTNPQSAAAMKKLLSDRIIEIVRVWKQDAKHAQAAEEATAEVNAITLE